MISRAYGKAVLAMDTPAIVDDDDEVFYLFL